MKEDFLESNTEKHPEEHSQKDNNKKHQTLEEENALLKKSIEELQSKILHNEELAMVERVNTNREFLSQRDKFNQIILDYRELTSSLQDALDEGLASKISRSIGNSARRLKKQKDKSKTSTDENKSPKDDFIDQIHAISLWGDNNLEYVSKNKQPVKADETDVRLVAFYFPEMGLEPHNDEESRDRLPVWASIGKTMPNFYGHYQPHLPGGLGFYDPDDIKTLRRQEELAKQYGIYGFCFCFLNPEKKMPAIEHIRNNRDLDLPFCIFLDMNEKAEHANINDPENERLFNNIFAQDIVSLLTDDRYIKINGKPVLLARWKDRETAKKAKKLLNENGARDFILLDMETPLSIKDFGKKDVFLEPQPQNILKKGCLPYQPEDIYVNPDWNGRIIDYKDIPLKKHYLKQTPFPQYKTVMLPYDDTAQKGTGALVFHNGTVTDYAEWLADSIRFTKERFNEGERLLFLRSWNGWAEGTNLEPDGRFGFAFLEATRACLLGNDEKRIIYVSHDAFPHGAQMLSLRIISALRDNLGYKVYVILRQGGEWVSEFEKQAADIVQVGRDIESEEQLIAKVKSWNIDKAICNTVVSGDILGILSDNGVRCISLIHEMPEIIREMEAEESFRTIARKADRIIFPSNFVQKRDGEIAAISPEKIIIRPQGLYKTNSQTNPDPDIRRQVRKELGLPESARIVLGMGIADRRKGIDLFAETAQKMRKENAYFVWVGNQETRFFKDVYEMCEKTGLLKSKRITFVPAVTDTAKYFAAADLFLLTSREDPFPSVVMEAMDAGVPVIAFEGCGGYTDIVCEDTGMLVPKEDVDAICRSIKNHFESAELYCRKSEHCRQLIQKEFSFIEYVKFLLQTLGECTEDC